MADQPNSERLRRLEEDVNQRVRDAFTGLREEVARRLRRLSDEALEALEGLGEGEPPTVLAAADLEPLARDAESAAGRRSGGELLAAVAALDRAGSQGEVLSVLAREAARFAERTALLLTRPSGAELWSAEGWGDVPSSLAFSYPETGGWSPQAFGRGAVELDGGGLGELAGRLGGDAPERAVLVPLVLRDRLAAVLYADGRGEAAGPSGPPLQVLAWAASQALESLPFRQREATPTLAGLGTGEPAGAPLALWGSEGTAEPAGEEPHGAGRAVGIAAAGLAAAGLAAAGVAAARRGRHDEGGEQAAEEAAEPAAPAPDALAAFDEITLEEGPGPAAAAPPVPSGEAEPAPAVETAALDAGWSLEEETALDSSAEEAASSDDEPSAAGFAFEEEPAGLPGVASREEAESADETRPPSVPLPEEGAAAAAGAESAAAEAADETHPGLAPPPPPPAAPAPPVAAPRPGGGSAEVAAPSDLEGPGRAFAGRGDASEDEDQARHDEARRLARLLVSEIRLYNEDEVEAGRRNGDVYERLKEDIDRSRQLYEERIDAQVREGTDYFYQELVRNLGGGDSRALGI